MFKKIFNSAILMTWARDFMRFGTPLVVVPLVVSVYDDIETTFYFTLNTIIFFAMLADSGFSSIVIRGVSYFMSGADSLPRNKEEFDNAEEYVNRKPNLEKLGKLFSTTKYIYFLLLALMLVIMSTGGVAAMWNVMDMADHRTDLWLAYAVIGIYCCVLVINYRWSAIMRGLDFVAVEARFTIITTSVRIGLFIVLLSFKLPPLALCLGFLLEGLVMHVYLRTYILRWLKKNKVQFKKNYFDKEIFHSMWSATWRIAGISWGNFFVERGNNIIILQASDPRLMASFTFTTYILKTLFSFAQSPLFSRVPVLYKLAAEKNMEQLKKTASGYMFIGLGMIITAYLLVGGLGNFALERLGADDRIMVFSLFAIMALTEILDLHSSFHAGVYTSTNHIPFFWPSIGAGVVIFLVGMYWSMPLYGVVGIIYTRFLIQLGFNNWYAMALNLKLLKWPLYKFIYQMPYYGIKFITSSGLHFIPGRFRKK